MKADTTIFIVARKEEATMHQWEGLTTLTQSYYYKKVNRMAWVGVNFRAHPAHVDLGPFLHITDWMNEWTCLSVLPRKTYTGEGSASSEKLKNLFGDQREDSLTSLEVCKLLKSK